MVGRIKYAKRNIIAGMINSIILIALPFIVRTVFAYTLGAEYLGLNSLFSSILTVLNLTELGVGSALVYSMYKPAAENDYPKISALLALYRKIYNIIGISVIILGFLFVPFLPFLVKGDIPRDININILFTIYLVDTSVSYLGYAYRKSLLIAYQRQDVISNINTVISITLYVVQITVLMIFRNYYVYIVFPPIFAFVENCICARFSSKVIQGVKPEGKVDIAAKKDIKDHIKGIALQKICSTSRNAFDSIAISMFLGLVSTAMYNNYYYIMISVHKLLYQIPNSIRASVGNSVVTESERQNYQLFSKMNLIYVWISGWATVCFACLYQPFMEIWMGKDMLLPFHTVILLCIYFYELSLGDMVALYKDAAGLWWHGRYRTIIEAAANLILNFLLGYFYGVDGIIFATVITILFFGIIYGGYIVFRYYFKSYKLRRYLLSQLSYFLVVLISVGVTYFVVSFVTINGILGIALRLLIATLLSNIILFIFLRNSRYYIDAKKFVIGIIRHT